MLKAYWIVCVSVRDAFALRSRRNHGYECERNGNFLFSLGPNNEAGGDRTTACHLDIPLRGCAVKVDGIEVVKDGALSRA